MPERSISGVGAILRRQGKKGAPGTSSRQVANEIALIDAATAVDVYHIVKLSVMGPPSRVHPFDWHMEIETHLAKKEIGYTILRRLRLWTSSNGRRWRLSTDRGAVPGRWACQTDRHPRHRRRGADCFARSEPHQRTARVLSNWSGTCDHALDRGRTVPAPRIRGQLRTSHTHDAE